MDDLRPRLERALAGTYTFERELGGGGMSRTYVAVERALDRRVVVKVLAPELLAGISVERFRREVLLAAQLQHPHVVPVLTAGDTDGLPWFTMPYVDGDSLRQRLAQGPLGIGEIVSILRDVARALAYAHAHGIVHRDIKPDNVLLSAGSATVTDFGIAKAISAARSPEAPATFGTSLTVAGTSIGTPTYMAPEQAVGDPNTDHRADLYSFGAMAYELLAGRPPFDGAHPSALVAAHLSETPGEVRALRPDCPPALAALVMHCLAKQPDDRPQAAADIARVLDSITSSGAAAAAPAILAGGRTRFSRALAVWAALTALVALTAWAATRVIGLPDWALPGAVGVMLAGLPVIAATWYAQQVVHRAYVATPTLTPGGSRVPPPHGTMATLAIKASPHLSWRRTWLGGGIAVGSFAALVVAFLVMRAMGIGPFGSLRGRGEFGARETIVVADFVSPPGDSTLGATVAEALRTDLAQSRALRVLTRANVREVLRLMQRPVESTVLFDLAREIATREGAKAVLDGGIERLGQSYVISARLVGSLNGQELATFRETARSEDELLEALGKLSRAVRDVSGESLRDLRMTKDLERVTTPSLAALRKYVEGALVADERGDVQRGLALLQEAVSIDTGFAMAWRKIAVLLGNEGRERARGIAAIERAYAHRERLSELERLTTEGYYFTRGPRPDRTRALAAYEGVIALDSLSSAATNNAAVILTDMREWERARELYRRVTRLPRSFGGAFTNLMQMQIHTGQLAGLDSTRAEYRRRYPESADVWEADFFVAWGHGDLAASDSVARAAATAARTVRSTIRSNYILGDLAALRGRPAEAMRHNGVATATERRAGGGEAAALSGSLDSIWVEVTQLGRTASARDRIDATLRAHPIDRVPAADRPWALITQLGIMLADPEITRMGADGYERDIAPMTPDPDAARVLARAARAFAERRYDEAASATLEADRRFALPWNTALINVARAYDAAGRADSAIAYYTTHLERPDPLTFDAGSYRASTLRRLGELHETRGEAAKAIEYYQRLVDLWADAEPAMQPQVADVRARIERLRKPM